MKWLIHACSRVIVVVSVQHTASVVVIKLALVGTDSVLNVSISMLIIRVGLIVAKFNI